MFTSKNLRSLGLLQGEGNRAEAVYAQDCVGELLRQCAVKVAIATRDSHPRLAGGNYDMPRAMGSEILRVAAG